MIKEERTGKELADHFAQLSQSVGVFSTTLKEELKGIKLTGHLEAVIESNLEEIKALESKLDRQDKIVSLSQFLSPKNAN
jgi:hypothetical protein